MPSDDKYPVGYKRPPKSSRWKKGQSGNPKGRPKGSGRQQISRMLRKVMNEKVEVVIGGETRVVRQRELVIRGLMNKAMKGDTAAFRAIMELYAVEELEQPNQCSLVIFESELGL